MNPSYDIELFYLTPHITDILSPPRTTVLFVPLRDPGPSGALAAGLVHISLRILVLGLGAKVSEQCGDSSLTDVDGDVAIEGELNVTLEDGVEFAPVEEGLLGGPVVALDERVVERVVLPVVGTLRLIDRHGDAGGRMDVGRNVVDSSIGIVDEERILASALTLLETVPALGMRGPALYQVLLGVLVDMDAIVAVWHGWMDVKSFVVLGWRLGEFGGGCRQSRPQGRDGSGYDGEEKHGIIPISLFLWVFSSFFFFIFFVP